MMDFINNLSTENIIIIVAILAVIVLGLLILLLVMNSRRKKRKEVVDINQEQTVATATPARTETAKIIEDAATLLPVAEEETTLDKEFSDAGLIEVLTERFQVLPGEPIQKSRFLEVKELIGTNKNITDLSGISKLKNLEAIDFSDNKIQMLPTDFSELKQLKIIDLSKNLLHEVPATIGGFAELSELNLASNHLVTLPLEMSELPKIVSVNLDDNTQLRLPENLKEKLVEKNVQITEPTSNLREDDTLTSLTVVSEHTLPAEKTLDQLIEEFNVDSFHTLNSSEIDLTPLQELEIDNRVGEMKMAKANTNTYIDLTSNNEDLLLEIAALEKNLSENVNESIPTLTELLDSEVVSLDGENVASELLDGLEEASAPAAAVIEETEQLLRNKDNINKGDKTEMVELVEVRTEEEVLSKKEKRNKIIKIASAVAGATAAVVTIAGAGFYFYTKNKKIQQPVKRKTTYFFKKGE